MTAGISGMSRTLPSTNINTIKTHLKQAVNSNKTVSDTALEALGIDRGDQEAKETMRSRLVRVLSPHAKIFPAPKDPNIFYVFNLEKVINKKEVSSAIEKALSEGKLQEYIKNDVIPAPEGVFKIGSKRALLEVTFRKIAYNLGLAKYAIPGVFCVLQRPDLSKWGNQGKAEEELWNGNIKEFIPEGISERSTVMGIFEPFLRKEELPKEEEKRLFVFLVVLALATGLRDVKSENVLMQFLDNEEYFPERLEPPKKSERACPATHLPFVLESVLRDEIIEQGLLKEVRGIVAQWNPEKQAEALKGLEVVYSDNICESIVINDKEDFDDDDIEGVAVEDQGGCAVTIYKPLDEMVIEENLFTIKNLKKDPFIFNNSQLETFKERLMKLKIILQNENLTPYRMIESLDRFYTQDVKLRSLVEELRGIALSKSGTTFSGGAASEGNYLGRAISEESQPKTPRTPCTPPVALTSGRFPQFTDICHASDNELFTLSVQVFEKERKEGKTWKARSPSHSLSSDE